MLKLAFFQGVTSTATRDRELSAVRHLFGSSRAHSIRVLFGFWQGNPPPNKPLPEPDSFFLPEPPAHLRSVPMSSRASFPTSFRSEMLSYLFFLVLIATTFLL